MKRLILSLLLSAASYASLYADGIVTYTYDDAGNRITRTTSSGTTRSTETPNPEKS